MFTPWLADSKTLIVRIKTTATQCQQKWLFARDIDVGDKRANLGLMLYGNSSILMYFLKYWPNIPSF